MKLRTLMTLAVLVIALASFGLLAACGDSETETTAAPATETTAAPATETTEADDGEEPADDGEWDGTFDGEYEMGLVCSMTGPGAMGGSEQLWAQEKAVADQNAKGGLFVDGKHLEIKLKVVDDKSMPTEAAAAMEKLIKVENCDIILSTQVTPINIAAAAIAEKYNVYYHMCVAYTDWVEEHEFQWATSIFFTPASSSESAFQIVELQPEDERPTNWGVLTEDNQDGQAIGDGIKAMAEKHGANIVEYQTYTPGAKDFSSALLKLKSAGVDALLGFSSPADGVTFVKQMRDMDFAPKFIMGWKGFWPQEFMEGLGPDSDYVVHDGFWSEDLGTPYAKELGEAYRADHNGLDSVSIGNPYAAAQTLFEAINRADSLDPGAVRDEVFGGTFTDTVYGDVTYSDTGVAQIDCLGMQWMDGKRIIVWPDKGNQLEWFKPWKDR